MGLNLRRALLSVIILTGIVCCGMAFADDGSSGIPLLDQVAAFLKPFLLAAVEKFPIGLAIVGVIGVLRLIFKPLMAFAHAIVDATPSPADNDLLAQAEASMPYKVLAFMLDYLGSIKLMK